LSIGWYRSLMKRSLVALLLASAAFVVGAQETVRDDRGVSVTLSATPARIISLLPSLTESVCAIGACSRVVGTDRFSNWPASVAALPKLGGVDDTQIESLVALRPDLVLAPMSARAVDRLEGLGFKVVVLESRNHADVQRTLTLLGRMLGRVTAADSVWADIERQTRDAAQKVPEAMRGKRVYFEADATPYAAGASSFIGETLTLLGMSNAIPAELGPFPELNPEYVVKIQPDIIVATRQSLVDMPKRPGWSSLRALQHQQTCGFSGARYDMLVRPGPRMGEAAGLLADCLADIAKRH
jgi:iron complex transport system substrate-binding protein